VAARIAKLMPEVSSYEGLAQQVTRWKEAGLKVGFTCGAFDLLHAGHAAYLSQARSLCDRLVVAVNSDASVRGYKNPFRPIVGEQHRIALVAALRSVDAVTLMMEERPARLIDLLHPDVYIKGGDYRVEQLRSAPLVEAYGGECKVIPVEHEISSSAIIRKIEQLALHAAPESNPARSANAIVFLDRDGTIIQNVHFLREPGQVKLVAGAGEGLRALQDAGFTLVVVTNQQGLGLGYFSYEEFVKVNSAMLRQLSQFGVKISRFYFCPHSMAEQCACRKPGSRLLERALADFKANAADCYLIGDTASDVEAAAAAGCKGILLAPGAEAFGEAVEKILLEQRSAVGVQ
jgi:rfaE bifunctional protein nucleotidyltransferase chain/domain